MDWCSTSSNAGVQPNRCGEEGVESEGKDLPVDLRSNPHLKG